ncbi:serine hydrolase domain-containing protein [Mesorhizobium carmichaelinearum]|uniref:serine hydrolase domain-containing protein n=1 Tax=Mesorhizobium carmichaelinearum TaxID=1208188 RepID=UPI0018E08DE3|nr:serine hydrolase domain-containing protein [Mesorhizobium carmichaelinearum]
MSQVDWAGMLAAYADVAGIPGAVLGISYDGKRIVVPYGVLSTATGVTTTVDSVFQIGSITKLWTATMVMQLIDERRLELDSTVAQLLPGVRVGVDDVADQITVRHLLTHSSGIDGDLMFDTGRGDDCLAKFAAQLADVAQIHPVGTAYSYCNAGFTLLGRIIEVLDGTGWDKALRRRLVEPLGLTATVTLPEEALLFRAAVGHQAHPHAGKPVHTWGLMRSDGPSGLITQSADDLLTFAELHLNHGVTGAGRSVLSADAVAAMLVEQVRPPVTSAPFAVGLTWRMSEWGGRRVIGHDGWTLGQRAFLRVDPEARLAVCLLTNSDALSPYERIISDVIEHYAGVRVPERPAPVDVLPYRPERHVGRYENAGGRLEVTARPAGLLATWTTKGDFAEIISGPAVNVYELLPLDESGDRYAFRSHPGQPWEAVTFARLNDGTLYVFIRDRITPKAASSN